MVHEEVFRWVLEGGIFLSPLIKGPLFINLVAKSYKMSLNDTIVAEPLAKNWGGKWTEKKLDAFEKYVRSYLTIMKKNPYWKTVYFDGFAGSGTRKRDINSELFNNLEITEEEELTYRGAAERVLGIKDLGFDYYYFIDLKEDSVVHLEKRLMSLPVSKDKTLAFRAGDANSWILELARALHAKKMAALIFLDPFGMQINWESISALQGTRSDIWILVPTGVIVNRLLDRKGELKSIKKLESFFGLSEGEIRKEFYTQKTEQTLFGEEMWTSKVNKPIEKIARLYAQRLKQVWKYVTEEPLVLRNRNNTPIFHFVFASNNTNALKIAKQIIERL
jgi:three-Cys-motif partner protein